MHAYRSFGRHIVVGLVVVMTATMGSSIRAAAGSGHGESGVDHRDGHGDRERNDDRDHDHSKSRRAGGTCTTTFRFTGPTTIHIDGRCDLLHLGATTLSAEQTVTQLPDGSLSAINDSIYTAANGDRLLSHFVGGATPSPTGLVLTGTETYVGGTGRFDDASGRSSLNGTVSFTSASEGIGEYTLAGRISFRSRSSQ